MQTQLTQTEQSLKQLQTLMTSSNHADCVKGYSSVLETVAKLYGNRTIDSLVPILPALLNLHGKPFSLQDYFPLEPMYKFTDLPPRTIIKAGRQISKSTTLGAQGVLRTVIRPYLNTIYVAPRFEQIRRFSNNVVRPFIQESPINSLLVGQGSAKRDNSVFQRTFRNESTMYFTFAFLDAERARGIAGDILNLDEIQDIDMDFLPVLESCLDASVDLGLVQMSGTPKTTDNTIHHAWLESSQAHWTMKCVHCSDWNIAALECGLDKMVREDGFCCKKCSELLNPRAGFYYHFYPDRRLKFPGYHIPQVIMPMHYANPGKWNRLYRKKLLWSPYSYHNEVLGESSDVGSRIVTEDQLRACANLPWRNTIDEAIKQVGNYEMLMMGVDWGSGAAGKVVKRKNQIIIAGGTESFTVMTIVGFKGNARGEVLYTERLNIGLAPEEEVRHIIQTYHKFKCFILAHDYGGAGFLRESMLLQSGMNPDRTMPCMYTHAPVKPIITFEASDVGGRVRHYYSVDKARSLMLLCASINANFIRFPKWDDLSDSIYLDFLALVAEVRESSGGSDQFRIIRNPKKTDDFCHSLNLACIAYWHHKQIYPGLASELGVDFGSEKTIYEPYDWGN